MNIKIMTVAELAERIASKLNYHRIWESSFPQYDFASFANPFSKDYKAYSAEELAQFYIDVTGWCSFRKLSPGLGSTNLYTISDLYGGGNDQICRLYDGIGKVAAEVLIQEALLNTIPCETSNCKDSLLIVEEIATEKAAGNSLPKEPAAQPHVEKASEKPSCCQEGICPICGGELEYTGCREDDDDGCTYPWTCKACGATGKEGYTLQFDGKHYDVQDEDGEDVDIDALGRTPLTEEMIRAHYKTIPLQVSDSFTIDIPFDLAWQVANAVDECYACIDILSQIPEDKRNKVTYEQLAAIADDYKDYRAAGMDYESAADQVIEVLLAPEWDDEEDE